MKSVFQNLKRRGLAVKLSFSILIGTTLIAAVSFAYEYWYSSRLVLQNVEADAGNLAQATVNEVESVLVGITKVIMFTTSYLEHHEYTEEDMLGILEHIVSSNDEVYGSTIAYEPYAHDPDKHYFAPYYYKKNGRLTLTDLSTENYRYHEKDWYTVPKATNRPAWSEPYYDEGGGNIFMATYSLPFYKTVDGNRTLQGIVTADISLDWLVRIISSATTYKSGYSFMISKNGSFVSHPDESLIKVENIFTIADALDEPRLREIGENMIRGETGFVPHVSFHLNRPSWLYYAPLPTTGWSMGTVVLEDELFAGLHELNRQVILIAVGGFAILLVVIFAIASRMIRPLETLASTTTEIARGNLDIELPQVSSHDEVGDLSRAFEEMRVSLKEYISNLAETIKAKERLDSELKIAHNIQMNFLPKRFPPFPDKSEFQIYARLEPAKYVGGDLFDFFLLDDNKLFISIGDVADKGVPAALFMAMTKTLMKGVAEQEPGPAELLMRVNNEIARDNDTSMFVTLICGILNLDTGELIYSNAGHNPPVLIRNNQAPEWLDIPEGFILGPIMDTVYKNDRITLNPGDLLLLYTDGVNEAMNEKRVLYSDERLIDTVTGRKSDATEDLVHLVMESVENHSGAQEQSDDITILALRYDGRDESNKTV